VYQQCIIVGNLGRDPEMRYTPSGVPVTSFSVAVNNRYQDSDGEWRDRTTWFRVSCWRRLAETTNQYLKKGRQVMVIGRVDTSAWIDKQSGEARSALELTALDVRFLGGREDAAGGPGASGEGYGGDYAESEEELPF
jgi:single-strand DNA-binding protein